ncbi:hypothetical protein D3C76_321810 [compost metagenome]
MGQNLYRRYFLFPAILALFIVFCLPCTSAYFEQNLRIEQESVEANDFNRAHKVQLRLTAPQKTKYFSQDRVLLFRSVPVAFYLPFAALALMFMFRPFFCLFLKRKILLPIKFTSKYVA